MNNSALGNNKNYLPLLSITRQQIANVLSVAAFMFSDVSLQFIGQYHMKALIGHMENNS